LAAFRSGELRPGDRVAETAIARALGVSFSPIREALFDLANQGILTHRPRRGFVVSSLGDDEVREIFSFRAFLDGFAARAVVERRLADRDYGEPLDISALDALDALVADGERAVHAGDLVAVAACNAQFHDTILQLAAHRLARRAWDLLAPATWLMTPGLMLVAPSPERVEDWPERHRRLAVVLRNGTADEAAREAAAHVMEAGHGRLRRAAAARTAD
jgi:DNA-binding GntR family transcriptional regulator